LGALACRECEYERQQENDAAKFFHFVLRVK
jgi:hypothetical protein